MLWRAYFVRTAAAYPEFECPENIDIFQQLPPRCFAVALTCGAPGVHVAIGHGKWAGSHPASLKTSQQHRQLSAQLLSTVAGLWFPESVSKVVSTEGDNATRTQSQPLPATGCQPHAPQRHVQAMPARPACHAPIFPGHGCIADFLLPGADDFGLTFR